MASPPWLASDRISRDEFATGADGFDAVISHGFTSLVIGGVALPGPKMKCGPISTVILAHRCTLQWRSDCAQQIAVSPIQRQHQADSARHAVPMSNLIDLVRGPIPEISRRAET